MGGHAFGGLCHVFSIPIFPPYVCSKRRFDPNLLQKHNFLYQKKLCLRFAHIILGYNFFVQNIFLTKSIGKFIYVFLYILLSQNVCHGKHFFKVDHLSRLQKEIVLYFPLKIYAISIII